MCYVAVRHDERPFPNGCGTATCRSATTEVCILTYATIRTYSQYRGLASVLEVLWCCPNSGKCMDQTVCPNCCVPNNPHMRVEMHTIAKRCVGSNKTEWAYMDTLAHPATGFQHCSMVDTWHAKYITTSF